VAYINDQMLELSARELSLLEVLLQRAGRLVSKDQLVERLCEWGEEVSNNAIEVYIHRLRKKIEQGPIRIATVRGLGYCLEKIPHDHALAAARGRRPGGGAWHAKARRSARCSARSSTGCWPLLLLWPMSVALTWLVAQGIATGPSTARWARWRATWPAGGAVEARPRAGLATPGARGRALLRADDPTRSTTRCGRGRRAAPATALPVPSDEDPIVPGAALAR
jgi:biotin operon repressor